MGINASNNPTECSPIVLTRFTGEFASLLALQTAYPTAPTGSYAIVNQSGTDIIYYFSTADNDWFTNSGSLGGSSLTPYIELDPSRDLEIADLSRLLLPIQDGSPYGVYSIPNSVFSSGNRIEILAQFATTFTTVLVIPIGVNVVLNGVTITDDYRFIPQGYKAILINKGGNEWVMTYEVSGIPTLQEVTNEGAVSDKIITVKAVESAVLSSPDTPTTGNALFQFINYSLNWIFDTWLFRIVKNNDAVSTSSTSLKAPYNSGILEIIRPLKYTASDITISKSDQAYVLRAVNGLSFKVPNGVNSTDGDYQFLSDTSSDVFILPDTSVIINGSNAPIKIPRYKIARLKYVSSNNWILSYSESIDLSNYALTSDLTNKVDKIAGKSLSTNDFTNTDKTKLDNLSNYMGFRGAQSSLANIISAYPTGTIGDWAIITNASGNAYFAVWDSDASTPQWVEAGQSPTIPGTNLNVSISGNTLTITSDTGNDVAIPLATITAAGLQSKEDKTKLDGIATGATANSSDATLLNRSNHTGTQLAATISDFGTAVGTLITSALSTFKTANFLDFTSSGQTQIDGKQAKSVQIKLTSPYTLTSQTALQKIANTGGPNNDGSFNVISGETYEFKIRISLNSLSTTASNITFGILGTATISGLEAISIASKNALLANASPNFNKITANTATAICSNTGFAFGFAFIEGSYTATSNGTIIFSIGLGIAAAAIVDSTTVLINKKTS